MDTIQTKRKHENAFQTLSLQSSTTKISMGLFRKNALKFPPPLRCSSPQSEIRIPSKLGSFCTVTILPSSPLLHSALRNPHSPEIGFVLYRRNFLPPRSPRHSSQNEAGSPFHPSSFNLQPSYLLPPPPRPTIPIGVHSCPFVVQSARGPAHGVRVLRSPCPSLNLRIGFVLYRHGFSSPPPRCSSPHSAFRTPPPPLVRFSQPPMAIDKASGLGDIILAEPRGGTPVARHPRYPPIAR